MFSLLELFVTPNTNMGCLRALFKTLYAKLIFLHLRERNMDLYEIDDRITYFFRITCTYILLSILYGYIPQKGSFSNICTNSNFASGRNKFHVNEQRIYRVSFVSIKKKSVRNRIFTITINVNLLILILLNFYPEIEN
jgi:hypothetical protein